MLRRKVLQVLAALPAVSVPEWITKRVTGRLTLNTHPRLPHDRHFEYWVSFYAATRPDRALSTDRSREHAASGCRFKETTREEAIRALKFAHEGKLEIDDMPIEWRVSFDKLNPEFNTTDPELRDRYAARLKQLGRIFDQHDE